MEAATYRCPLCGRTMERNLVLFLNHTDQHVIDQVKKEHPEWVSKDGVCKPCAEYYRRQLSGESGEENIGPRGRKKRLGIGLVSLGMGLILALLFRSAQVDRIWFTILFLPFFGGMLGLIQSREKTCAFLAEQGLRNMDEGQGKVADSKAAAHLKRRGRGILVKSALAAFLLTTLLLLM